MFVCPKATPKTGFDARAVSSVTVLNWPPNTAPCTVSFAPLLMLVVPMPTPEGLYTKPLSDVTAVPVPATTSYSGRAAGVPVIVKFGYVPVTTFPPAPVRATV